MSGVLCVFTSKKNGNANSAQKIAAPIYTGRLPILSDSMENPSTVKICTKLAMTNPLNTMFFGRPKFLVR